MMKINVMICLAEKGKDKALETLTDFTMIERKKKARLNNVSEIPRYYSQDAVDTQHEQMMKEFGILGEEIENLKAENKRLKEERDELFEIFIRHVMRKMYPAKCTNKIQIFESREEYDKVAKFIFKIIQRRENGV